MTDPLDKYDDLIESLKRRPRRDDVPDALIRALHAAPHVPEGMIEEAAVHLRVGPGGRRTRELDDNPTFAELTVLGFLSHGMTLQMIADTLDLSRHTVYSQSRSARYRLKAKNTPHAVAIAIRRGLIP
jgi:DNA-binding CsgD family transcriptional regulator